MFRRLVVPVDGRLDGYELAERAIDLAAAFDATLHIVFVEALAPGFTTRGLAHASRQVATVEGEEDDAATAHVAAMADEAGVDCRTMTSRGERHLAILNAAREVDADLIVLSTPERRLWRRLPITAADHVFRHASTSIIALDL